MILTLRRTASDSTITVSAVGGDVTDRTPNDGIFAASNGGVRGYQFQLLSEDGATVLKDWTPAYPYHSKSSYTFSQAQDGVGIQAGTKYQVKMKAIDKAGNTTPARNIESEETQVTTKKTR